MAKQAPKPLAEQLRPHDLDDFVGQDHLVGEGRPIRLAIEQNDVPSMILWGPPGVGKTTLARIVAKHTNQKFHALSAVSAGKDDLRRIINATQIRNQPRGLFDSLESDDAPGGAILFLDEIHRFNKAQQDFLLPYVEDGTLTLIGATTENPSFEVIAALLSRLQVYILEPLSVDEIASITRRAGKYLQVQLEDDALDFLTLYANGDARASLNVLDNAKRLYAPRGGTLTLDHIKQAMQSKRLRYDNTGEEHYNTISAYIKSMRAGDVDAALYYLARMVEGGEDPKFIARRMVIFASEDVGMADPHALTLANAVFQAVDTVGLPEAQINLAHGTAYLATTGKNRLAYTAYFRALNDVQKYGNLEIPKTLRNAPTDLMKEIGYGSPEERDSLLPDPIQKRRYYVDFDAELDAIDDEDADG